MEIRITPDEIIKRNMWEAYFRYFLKNNHETAEKIIKENNVINLSEHDAYLLGLLNKIETPNLIHIFNSNITHLLSNKSKEHEGSIYINKNVIKTFVTSYINLNYPSFWEPTMEYRNSLLDLKDHIENILLGIEKLDVTKIANQNVFSDYISSSKLKKDYIKFKHYGNA